MSTKYNEERKKRAELVADYTQFLLDNNSLSVAKLVPAIKNKNPAFNTVEAELNFIQSYSEEASLGIDELNAVLIFCSSRRAGGGWLNGAKAQEEDVSLKSTWALQAKNAPRGFYEENDGMGNDFALISQSKWLNNNQEEIRDVVFLGVAAPNFNTNATLRKNKQLCIDALTFRVASAIEEAKKLNVQHLVLGAIGCGVFKWDVEDSAKALKEALIQSKYKGKVTFAIPDINFLNIFKKEFGVLNIKNKI